jgi:hypothetical protein
VSICTGIGSSSVRWSIPTTRAYCTCLLAWKAAILRSFHGAPSNGISTSSSLLASMPWSFSGATTCRAMMPSSFSIWSTNAEVVILGGGEVNLGFERYDAMGGYFFDDYDRFRNCLHQRQSTGKLTVGFSAGAAQLGDVCKLKTTTIAVTP